MLGVPIGKFDLKFVEAEIFHDCVGEIDAGFHFGLDLRCHAEDVRVVLRETPHAEQTMQHAAAFVAIDGAEFSKPDRQIAIAAHARFVNQNVAGAIHGLELIFGFFDFDRAEHVLFVEIGVTGSLPQIEQHDVRGVHKIVAALEQFIAQPGFDNVADEAALGVPENQAGAGFFLDAEKIEFRAKLAVIAALGFLEAVEMRVEFFLREKCRGVDALQLRIAFLAFPIRAGDAHQFERLNAFGRGNMRAAAEIDKFSGGVKRNHRVGDFFLDQFALKNLVGFFVKLDGLGLGQVLAFVRQILRGKFVHFLFDFRKVVEGERLLAHEFVKKAVVDWRADAQLDVRVKLHYSGGEQMRGGMAKDEK